MNFTRLFDLLPYQAYKYPQAVAMAHKVGDDWQTYSTEEVMQYADKVSKGLLAIGVQKGENVAMITSQNCPEWSFVDLGILQIGAVNVPLYPTTSLEEYVFILNHTEARFCFVNNKLLYEKLLKIQSQLPHLQAIYTFDKIISDAAITTSLPLHWQSLLEAGENGNIKDEQLQSIKTSIQPNDLATIIYTSGTTGTPKGVMLSHDNIVSNIKSVLTVLPVDHTNRMMSFLPISHIFERTVNYMYLAIGASIYYSSLGGFQENLQVVKPNYFTVVPRILEKIVERVERQAAKLKGQRLKVYQWAMQLGEQYELDVRKDWKYELKLKTARRLVFNKWQAALGGEVKGLVIGAAPLQPKLARLFTAAGIPIREGYGLTETAPVLAFNRFTPGGTMLGTVGVPIPSVDIKINKADGEILVKGPNVMLGYYKRPDLTNEVIDEEGWFHTGDVGEFIRGRFLKITDRKKEIFKISNGKFVAPQPIENLFKTSPYIDQILVGGRGRKFAAAIIVPNFEQLKSYCQDNNIAYTNNEALVKQPQILALYESIQKANNRQLSTSEQVRKFMLVAETWTVENGLLTPTLKLKRPAVYAKYHDLVEQMYT